MSFHCCKAFKPINQSIDGVRIWMWCWLVLWRASRRNIVVSLSYWNNRKQEQFNGSARFLLFQRASIIWLYDDRLSVLLFHHLTQRVTNQQVKSCTSCQPPAENFDFNWKETVSRLLSYFFNFTSSFVSPLPATTAIVVRFRTFAHTRLWSFAQIRII